MANIISDSQLPFITIAGSDDDKKIEESNKKPPERTNPVQVLYLIILIMFIFIILHDINLKSLNLYYKTKSYNDRLILKMFSV